MRSILIADDHSFIGEAIESFIEGDDYYVVEKAGDGESALKLLRKLKPDVLITDIAMPKTNGLELIRQVKDEMPNLKMMVFTMHISDNIVMEALELGVSAYLSKKTAPKELLIALDKILKGEEIDLTPPPPPVTMSKGKEEDSSDKIKDKKEDDSNNPQGSPVPA